jgi:hypothetical protein
MLSIIQIHKKTLLTDEARRVGCKKYTKGLRSQAKRQSDQRVRTGAFEAKNTSTIVIQRKGE